MKANSDKRRKRLGFTLLEVMVSVAILALSIVPILILREDSFTKAMTTKAERTAQQLAQQLISQLALEERVGEGGGEFEDWPDFRFEYTVTVYDFGTGMGDEDYYDEYGDPYYDQQPDDSVLFDEDLTDCGPLMTRHVEVIVYYPTFVGEDNLEEKEYIIDTYLPMLMTEEQYERQLNEESDT
jgi:prepilin-type N-terminal cleavage/methylation domain-containing protein